MESVYPKAPGNANNIYETVQTLFYQNINFFFNI